MQDYAEITETARCATLDTEEFCNKTNASLFSQFHYNLLHETFEKTVPVYATKLEASHLYTLQNNEIRQRCFAVSGPTLYNSLSLTICDPSLTLIQFCARLKSVILQSIWNTTFMPPWQLRLSGLLRVYKFTYLLTYLLTSQTCDTCMQTEHFQQKKNVGNW